MSLLLIIKLLIVVVFLIMFIRRPSVAWGVGLLTVSTAVLLDTLLNTFDHTELQAQLGFFYFVIIGALFGGGALWLWAVLRPYISPTQTAPPATIPPSQSNKQPSFSGGDSTFDRQMIYEQIRDRFGYEDVLDLMFDLDIHENDVITLDQTMQGLIVNIMDVAEARGQTAVLALAVERILTPLPADHLPRLEKLSADSPPTVLRQYLLAHYDVEALQQIAADLNIDWEDLGLASKKQKVRNLLLFLARRNRTDELLDWMHAHANNSQPSPKTEES